MATFQSLLTSLGQAKVKDMGKWAQQNLSVGSLNQATSAWLQSYGRKYVKTGSGKPIVHVMLALGLLGYTLNFAHISTVCPAQRSATHAHL
jgi:hypothetical protein